MKQLQGTVGRSRRSRDQSHLKLEGKIHRAMLVQTFEIINHQSEQSTKSMSVKTKIQHFKKLIDFTIKG
jgi:hypothetical protein